MQKRMNLIVMMAILVSLLVSACGPAASPTPVPPPPTSTPKANIALTISGGIVEMSWTLDELKAMDTLDVVYTDKDGTTTTYTGVRIGALVDIVGAEEKIFTLLVASDGYVGEIETDDVRACDNCIVAFDPEGGLRSVLPGESTKVQVKDLVAIRFRGTHD